MSELAHAVAREVMRAKDVQVLSPAQHYWYFPDGTQIDNAAWFPDTRGDHMLMVHEKMLADGYTCEVSAGPQGDHNAYYVKWPVVPSTKARVGVGRTLPEAVSNAALAAKRAEGREA